MNFYKIVLHKLRESGVLNRFDRWGGSVFMRMNIIIVYSMWEGLMWGNLYISREEIVCQVLRRDPCLI